MRPVLPVLMSLVALSTGISTARAQSQTARQPAQTSSPFLGGVPSGTATAEPVALTVVDAINRALEHNLGVLLSDDDKTRSDGARWRALGAMLPNVSGRVAETRQELNLAAYGFPLPAGIPSIVGPFNLFDARVYATQAIVDLRAINDLRAERHHLAATEHSYRSARDLVVLVAANAYLQALAASARVDAARAQSQTAEALYMQAADLRQNGIVPGIDVLRAEVQRETGRQRVTAAQNEFDKAKLQLARIVGLPPGQPLTLASDLPDVPVPDITFDAALARAYASRPDYQAALERVKEAEARRAAVLGDALPSVHVNADYGDLGLTLSNSHSTFAVTGSVSVPIFQGGRSRGRLLEADADLRSRRAEAEDLRAGIYYDVKTAFFDLQAGGEQLQVATRVRDLAAAALTQARDRFAAGVASNIEVIQAQEAVSVASEQYIAVLYQYNVTKAVLARDLGTAEQALRQYLGGAR